MDAAYTSGLIDTLQPTSEQLTEALLGGSFPVSDATLLSPPADIVNDISSTLSADYGSLLPIADTINALETSLTAFDASLVVDDLEAGNLLWRGRRSDRGRRCVDPVRALLGRRTDQ